MEVVTDEQHHHLESWRNRYRTDDVFPFFLTRVRESFDGPVVALVERYYAMGEIAQRSLIVLADVQPPVYPVLAELIEASSHSSLTALRLPSMLFSLGAVMMIGLAGRQAWDADTGLVAAALLAIAPLSAVYSGLGRPYALVQLTTAILLFAFLRDARRNSKTSLRWFLAAALVAQSTQWMAWAVAGPLVVAAMFRRLRWFDVEGMRLRDLLRASWWYVALSLLLLSYMSIHLMNPTVTDQASRPSFAEYWLHLSHSSPVAHLGEFSMTSAGIATVSFVVFFVLGLWVLLYPFRNGNREGSAVRESASGLAAASARFGLAASAIGAILAPWLIGSAERFWMTYVLPLILLCAIGIRSAVKSQMSLRMGTALVAAAFGALYMVKPIDGYRWMRDEVRWSTVAEVLQIHARPEDRWLSMPYFLSNNLYSHLDRTRVTSPPLRSSSERALEFIKSRPEGTSGFVLGYPTVLEEEGLTERADARWDFSGRIMLLRFDPLVAPDQAPTRAVGIR